jgi:voltage-gated potassium channel
MKKVLHKAFVNTKSKTYYQTNNFLAWLTVISILSLVLETVSSLSEYARIFFIIEWVSVLIFTGEYVGRWIISKPVWKYPLSFFGIVDLVAIVPTFLGMGNLTFLKSARSLRIIRLLRMVRLVKVARSGPKTDDMSVATLNIVIYFVVLLIALLLTGTSMYLVEPNLAAFSSIPSGMWWSFKVFLASIPVVYPETAIGEGFYVLTRFVGLLMLGLLVGVVGNVFKSLLLGGKK